VSNVSANCGKSRVGYLPQSRADLQCGTHFTPKWPTCTAHARYGSRRLSRGDLVVIMHSSQGDSEGRGLLHLRNRAELYQGNYTDIARLPPRTAVHFVDVAALPRPEVRSLYFIWQAPFVTSSRYSARRRSADTTTLVRWSQNNDHGRLSNLAAECVPGFRKWHASLQ
jgi:hypothetical protein